MKSPSGLAMVGANMYWVTAAGELRRAPASGLGPVTTVATVGSGARCLAVDATHANVGRNTLAPIARVTLSNAAIQNLASFDAASGIAIGSSGDLFFGHAVSDSLWTVPISGAAASEFVKLGAGRQVTDLERDGTTVWVASAGSGEILRVDETCKVVSTAYGTTATTLALSPTHVYWTTSGTWQVFSLPR